MKQKANFLRERRLDSWGGPLLSWALVLLFSLSVAHTSWAYNTTRGKSGDLKWFPDSIPVKYWVNLGDFTKLADFTYKIVQDSFKKWEEPACSNLRFRYEGKTQIGLNCQDGKNIVIFRNQWNNLPSNALGVTFLCALDPRTGGLYDRDIAIQGSIDWKAKTIEMTHYDLNSVLTHEIGHLLGLDHTPVVTAMMFPYYSPPAMSGLQQDDINGLCHLYPSRGDYRDGSCKSQQDCAANRLCQNGKCVAKTTGWGKLCQPCDPQKQNCGNPGKSYCLAFRNGWSVCGAPCKLDSDCPTGYSCYPLDAYKRQCLPHPYFLNHKVCPPINGCTKDADCGAAFSCDKGVCTMPLARRGETCNDRVYCRSGLQCFRLQGSSDGRCFELCPAGACSGGEKCRSLRDGLRVCFCSSNSDCTRGGTCGVKGMCEGAKECNTDNDCVQARHRCLQNKCVPVECVVHSDCSAGDQCNNYKCVGGQPPQKKKLGEPCSANEDCESGFCSSSSGQKVCATSTTTKKKMGEPCKGNAECESGSCFGTTGRRICSLPCEANSTTCGTAYECHSSGYCWLKATKSSCSAHKECQSGLCLQHEGRPLCVLPCDPIDDRCGTGKKCIPYDKERTKGYCWEEEETPEPPKACGCRLSPSSPPASSLLLLLFFFFVWCFAKFRTRR